MQAVGSSMRRIRYDEIFVMVVVCMHVRVCVVYGGCAGACVHAPASTACGAGSECSCKSVCMYLAIIRQLNQNSHGIQRR